MERLVGCIKKGRLDILTDFAKSLKDINSVLISEDDCNLNLLHIVAGIDSVFRDDVINLIVTFDELDINQPSGPGNDCYTAAHIAACNGYSTTLKCLLQLGADPYSLDINCNTVWDIASAYGNFDCILVLENEASKPQPQPATKDDIDDSVYYSLSSLECSGDTTIKFSDQSSVIFVKAKQDHTVIKTEDRMSQRAPTDPNAKTKPKTISRKQYQPKINWLRDKKNDTIIYKDDDFNVTLVESKADDSLRSTNESNSSPDSSILPPIDSNLSKLTDQEIRQQLLKYGESPGPVNATTRNVYLRRLDKIKSNALTIRSPLKQSPSKQMTDKSPFKKSSLPLSSYSSNINSIISQRFDFEQARKLEKEFMLTFSVPKGPVDFFNYLLLDPRRTCNLSQKANESQDQKIESHLFVKFIKSIFYIGKGKANRPYMHLYEAALPCKKKPISAKVKKITEIWDQGYGVISHHLFFGMSSDEAYTRESLMIDAIGIDKLTNIRMGQNKMNSAVWTEAKKTTLGTYFLWKAYKTLILNGERQIKRLDIRSNTANSP